MMMIIFLLCLYLQFIAAYNNATTNTFEFFDTSSSPPSYLPPARKKLPLYLSAGGWNYLVNMTFGTPSQPLSLIFDTGSPDALLWEKAICVSPAFYQNYWSCFNATQSSTYSSPLLYSDFSLVVDGEDVVGKQCYVSKDNCELKVDLLGPSAQETLQTSAVFLLVDSFSSTPAFRAANGLLGASYPSSSTRFYTLPWLNLLANDSESPSQPIFSLDFNKDSGSLYIGGIEESFRESLTWGMRAPSTDAFHTTRIFDFTLCDDNIFASLASQGYPLQNGTIAIIDTASSCLNLPAEIFDAVMARLPAACGFSGKNPLPVEECLSSFDKSTFYVSNTGLDNLPTISFRLQPGGPLLYLPLSSLLMPPVAHPPNLLWPQDTAQIPLCIARSPSINQGGPVVFGSYALRAFFVTLAMNTHQVAFANKLTFTASNIQCVKPPVCVGMQTHNPTFNICEDPPCAQYYFFELDAQTMTCKLSVSFHAVAITLIIIFLLVQLSFNEIHMRLSEQVVETIDET